MPVPIHLDNFFYKKLNIEWIDGAQNDETPYQIKFSFDLKNKKDDPNHILLIFGVKVFPSENFQGVSVDTIIEGFFSVNETIEEEKRAFYSMVNSASILYGIFRGQINLFTTCFPEGKILLPTVMMQDEIKNYFSQITSTTGKRKTKKTSSK